MNRVSVTHIGQLYEALDKVMRQGWMTEGGVGGLGTVSQQREGRTEKTLEVTEAKIFQI